MGFPLQKAPFPLMAVYNFPLKGRRTTARAARRPRPIPTEMATFSLLHRFEVSNYLIIDF